MHNFYTPDRRSLSSPCSNRWKPRVKIRSPLPGRLNPPWGANTPSPVNPAIERRSWKPRAKASTPPPLRSVGVIAPRPTRPGARGTAARGSASVEKRIGSPLVFRASDSSAYALLRQVVQTFDGSV
jgi:hypothetical protein